MEIQKSKIQNEAIYQPVKFVYSETIGLSNNGNYNKDNDPYTWTYEDILQPKPLATNKVYYYLFHIAPIYNWLRKQSATILKFYIDLENNNKQKVKQNKHKSQFDFQKDINNYLKQWEIVKLCACVKIKVQGANDFDNGKQLLAVEGNKQTKINKQSKLQNMPKTTIQPQAVQAEKCLHLIKKQVFSSQYFLKPTLQQGNYTLQCTTHFCPQCQKQVPVKSQSLQCPFAPFFKRYYEKQFYVNHKKQKIKYSICLIYGDNHSYIKTSSGVWYEVDKQKTSMISFQKINLKGGKYFVYQKCMSSNNILRKALPMINEHAHKQEAMETYSEDQQYQQNLLKQKLQKDKHSQIKKSKNQPSNDKNHQINPKTKQNGNQNNANQIQIEQQEQKLQQMVKNPLTYVLNKKKTDHKVYKQYKKALENILPKQKEKDQYQKDYDKGKTKKIHKNRQKQTTANFFQLYKNIKNNPSLITVEKKEKQIDQQNSSNQQGQKTVPNGQAQKVDSDRLNKKDKFKNKHFNKNSQKGNFHKKPFNKGNDNKKRFKKFK